MYTIAKFKTLNLSLALILLLLASANLTANTLKDISFSALPGNKAEIILKLDEPISKPSSFSTDNPARIAIDLDNTSSQIGKQAQNIGIGMARSITAIEAGDKTRVVINLVSAVGHTISTEGNEILVVVGAGSGSAASTPSKQALATSSKVLGKANNSITSIDFNRGEKGKAEIILGISNPEAIVDMRTEAGQLVLEVINSDVDASLARKLDVSDFATPVLSIETRPSGNNVKVKIEATGDYDHLAYQLDDSYVLEVRPKTKEELEKEKREKKIFTGERLSLNFQDIEVRSVLQLLADFTGLNMVVSDNVSGNVTLRLKNVPWDQAMDIILRTKGLGMRQNENVVYIAPAQEITTWEKNELEARKEIEELAPLRTELIQINYASADDIAALLSSRQGSGNNETDDELKLLSSRGTVTVDARTNSILVQDTAEKLKEMRDLIAQIDIPVKQVMIEARVVTANSNWSEEFGVRWGLSQAPKYTYDETTGNTITSSKILKGEPNKNLNFTGSLAGDIDNTGAVAEDIVVDLGATFAAGGIDLVIGKIGSHILGLELTAAEAEQQAEVLANPRLLTADKSSATIEQGVDIPYQESAENGGTTTAFYKAVLNLTVTPQITPDDRVIMDLNVTQDAPDPTSGAIDTRSITTNVLVDNGETVVLGGIFEQTNSQRKTQVPFFGDLPVVGWAFKNTVDTLNERELLIFVTPRIIKESLTLQ